MKKNWKTTIKDYLISIKNFFICLRYPFLKCHNRWTDETYGYSWLEIDSMPTGWRKAFGIKLCKELKRELKKHKFLKKYRITQIKEKFGALRWYDAGNTDNGYKILSKYGQLSQETCIRCGKPATKIRCGYISPYCDDCISERYDYVPITEEDAWDKAYTYYWPEDKK